MAEVLAKKADPAGLRTACILTKLDSELAYSGSKRRNDNLGLMTSGKCRGVTGLSEKDKTDGKNYDDVRSKEGDVLKKIWPEVPEGFLGVGPATAAIMERASASTEANFRDLAAKLPDLEGFATRILGNDTFLTIDVDASVDSIIFAVHQSLQPMTHELANMASQGVRCGTVAANKILASNLKKYWASYKWADNDVEICKTVMPKTNRYNSDVEPCVKELVRRFTIGLRPFIDEYMASVREGVTACVKQASESAIFRLPYHRAVTRDFSKAMENVSGPLFGDIELNSTAIVALLSAGGYDAAPFVVDACNEECASTGVSYNAQEGKVGCVVSAQASPSVTSADPPAADFDLPLRANGTAISCVARYITDEITSSVNVLAIADINVKVLQPMQRQEHLMKLTKFFASDAYRPILLQQDSDLTAEREKASAVLKALKEIRAVLLAM